MLKIPKTELWLEDSVKIPKKMLLQEYWVFKIPKKCYDKNTECLKYLKNVRTIRLNVNNT